MKKGVLLTFFLCVTLGIRWCFEYENVVFCTNNNERCRADTSNNITIKEDILVLNTKGNVTVKCFQTKFLKIEVGNLVNRIDLVLNKTDVEITNKEMSYENVYNKSIVILPFKSSSLTQKHDTDNCGKTSHCQVCIGSGTDIAWCSRCQDGYTLKFCLLLDAYYCDSSDYNLCSVVCEQYNNYTTTINSNKCCVNNCLVGTCLSTNVSTRGRCTHCEYKYALNGETPETSVCRLYKYADATHSCIRSEYTNPDICIDCNYPGMPNSNGECVDCSDIVGCLFCSQTEYKCYRCDVNYYLDNKICSQCSPTCNGCNTTTGYCTKCQINYVVTDPISRVCESCQIFDFNCVDCEGGGSRSCYNCRDGYYPDPSTGKCISCDLTCESNSCDVHTGVCKQCVNDKFVLKNSTGSVSCEACSAFDSNCFECSTTSRKCIICIKGYYPSTVSPFKCIPCDTSCQNGCDTIYGNCYSCSSDQYTINSETPTKCQKCTDYDSNCLACSTTSRGCISCTPNSSYLDGNKCKMCDNTCSRCSITGSCILCKSGYVPSIDTTSKGCISCSQFDSKCITCELATQRKCKKCVFGYYPSTAGTCVECDPSCNGNDKCDQLSGLCFSCTNNYVVTSPSTITCVNCSVFDEHCDDCGNSGQRICLKCKVGYRLDTNKTCVSCDSTCQPNTCDISTGICHNVSPIIL
ncbi:hypothetical protein EIN_473240 [Entamoeba invadens IP1]|uniref:EGF-like domain-containing protein n=1 Tax=Entamoeba invadens IP1 TaxID=370355 RepID=A0A0A1U6I3_ENTIV|nr:hypothetical protein EIN_473240 [Entamoeba invadens IP1]ELP89916.1 hypothetical protein EIN_473240 [Entamoeba invadens IP1]|eukprot:XP_004256687.1 hypothetical protein EIN_473240 [Entamoeba invadens IP1]